MPDPRSCDPGDPPRHVPRGSAVEADRFDAVATAILDFAAKCRAEILDDPDEDPDDVEGRIADLFEWSDAHLVELAGGLPLRGIGATRVVYALDATRVLKVEFQTSGDQNAHEVDRWEQAPAEVARDLAPLLAADPGLGWLVMASTTEVPTARREEAVRVLRRVRDINPSNVGLYCGRVVLHDYGN